MPPPLIAYYGEEYTYSIETIKGPTDFNVSELPNGLMVDPQKGIIYGEANETGEFEIVVTASNQSGSDTKEFSDPPLIVLKGRQSILSGVEEDLLFYGDPPLDLNLTSTSGLPVSIEIVEGNQSVDLNNTLLTIKDSGFVSLKASQEGDENWQAAQAILLNFQIMPKELSIITDDQFRRPEEANPVFSYNVYGLAYDDLESDLNISVITPVGDGNLTHPTPKDYMKLRPRLISHPNTFLPTRMETLTVSPRTEQEIVFDQNLSDIPATEPLLSLQDFQGRLMATLPDFL